ncbi:MAG: hypothetical protein ACYSUD_06740 [Planctomycetota bacterium]|jgi:hypothetical protein
MEYSRSHGAYFIIAGSSDEDDEFALYRWSGQPNAPPVFWKASTETTARA